MVTMSLENVRTDEGKPYSDAVMRQCFRSADIERKGWLSQEELAVAMTELSGREPLEYTLEQMKRQLEGNPMTEDVFVKLMTRRASYIPASDIHRQMFLAFTVSGHGFISREDLATVMSTHAPGIQSQVIDEAFDAVDTDQDGRITFHDFENMLNTNL